VLLKVIMAGVIVLFLLESITYVEEGQVGLLRRFGKYVRHGAGERGGEVRRFRPGRPIFLLPAPIDELERIAVEETKEIRLDEEFWPFLDREERLTAQQDRLPPQPYLRAGRDGYTVTGDLNLVHSRWIVRYEIEDPEAYRTEAVDPEAVLRSVSRAAILQVFAGASVDDVLYQNTQVLTDRIRERIRRAMQTASGAPQYGIRVTEVQTQGNVLPPGRAHPAFNNVTRARAARKADEEAARTEAETIRNEAQAEANRIVTDARTYRKQVVSGARADAEALTALLGEFAGQPAALAVYLQLYRLEVLEETLPETKRYIVRPGETWFMANPDPLRDFQRDEGDDRRRRR
jgi:regulator of protease activity HflC (stomatin/prohibitin superfamily)